MFYVITIDDFNSDTTYYKLVSQVVKVKSRLIIVLFS